jgi:hypothetical protein
MLELVAVVLTAAEGLSSRRMTASRRISSGKVVAEMMCSEGILVPRERSLVAERETAEKMLAEGKMPAAGTLTPDVKRTPEEGMIV